MSDAQKSAVIKFYDAHPINEDEILAKLAARRVSFDALTEDDLKDFGLRRPLISALNVRFGGMRQSISG